jgi:hypothetical protein
VATTSVRRWVISLVTRLNSKDHKYFSFGELSGIRFKVGTRETKIPHCPCQGWPFWKVQIKLLWMAYTKFKDVANGHMFDQQYSTIFSGWAYLAMWNRKKQGGGDYYWLMIKLDIWHIWVSSIVCKVWFKGILSPRGNV